MTWLLTVLLLFSTVTAVDSRTFSMERNAGHYRVEAGIDRNPLVIGDNHLEIRIRDEAGKAVTDAKVLVNYYMPPMPRMAPMNYRTRTELKGDRYLATMGIIMAGPWYVRVIIDRAGKTVTTKFNVDAQ